MAKTYKTWADGDAFTAVDANTYFMRQVNISVDNQSDRDAILTPQEGMQVWRKDLDGFELYDGSEWNLVPRLLKKTELTSVGDQLSAQSIPIRNSLTIRWFAVSSGVIHPWLRINNDGANRYTCRYRSNTTDGSAVNQ